MFEHRVKRKTSFLHRFAMLHLVKTFIGIWFKFEEILKFKFNDFYKEMYGRRATTPARHTPLGKNRHFCISRESDVCETLYFCLHLVWRMFSIEFKILPCRVRRKCARNFKSRLPSLQYVSDF